MTEILKLRFVIILSMVLLWPCVSYSKGKNDKLDMDAYHAEILDLSLAQNLQGPEIPKKQIQPIEAYQKNVALALKKRGFEVELMRDRQIVIVTIPMSSLFESGKNTLSRKAGAVLSKIAEFMQEPDKYKILVVAHSDDTGSEEYLNNLTDKRSNAVTEWLVDNHVALNNIVPYGLGADEPRSENSSRAGRDANRRIEIYLVPGPGMIERAKSGNL